jgi:hypothetical protein
LSRPAGRSASWSGRSNSSLSTGQRARRFRATRITLSLPDGISQAIAGFHAEAAPALAASADIILYREVANLPLAALEEPGATGREAYQTLTATEHFTPHTRSDVPFEPVAK